MLEVGMIVKDRFHPNHGEGEVLAITNDGRIMVLWYYDGYIQEIRSKRLEVID